MQGKPPVLRIGPQGGTRRVPSRPCRGCPADSIFSRSCTRTPQSIPPVVTLQPRRANHQWRISFSVVTLQPCRASHQWRILFSVTCLPCSHAVATLQRCRSVHPALRWRSGFDPPPRG